MSTGEMRTQFIDTSTELWGTEVYGSAAHDVLLREKSVFEACYDSAYVVGRTQREIINPRLASFLPESLDLKHRAIGGVIGTVPYSVLGNSEEERDCVESAVSLVWPHTYFPFASPTVAHDPDRPDTGEYHITLGPITQERISRYVRHKGVEAHGEQGAVGKIFDTLRVVGGLATKETAGSYPTPDLTTDYVRTADFREMVKQSTLSGRAQDTIIDRLHNESSLMVSDYKEPASLVFEGSVRWIKKGYWRSHSWLPVFEYVGKNALAGLFDDAYSAPPRVSRAIPDFLHDSLDA